MIKKFDRYLFFRLCSITLFVLLLLVFIFIVIDFSETSDEFSDRGAKMSQVFGVYYLNYIPEMIRLVIPVAVFVACLYLTGQLSDRLELTALKAAGVSLYRILIPYLVFAVLLTALISYLDGFVIPKANAERIEFESRFLHDRSERVDRSQIYRQESENSLLRINYFSVNENTGFRVEMLRFAGDSLQETVTAQRMHWSDEKDLWELVDVERRVFLPGGFVDTHADSVDTTLNIRPRDLARTTSDIFQLTYPEARDYIASIERSGAGAMNLPKIQLFGRLAYPFSIIVITVVGFSIASVRRKGGKGFYIAAGLTISFLYLVLMKLMEPLGSKGAVDPFIAASLPHMLFLGVGLFLLYNVRK